MPGQLKHHYTNEKNVGNDKVVHGIVENKIDYQLIAKKTRKERFCSYYTLV